MPAWPGRVGIATWVGDFFGGSFTKNTNVARSVFLVCNRPACLFDEYLLIHMVWQVLRTYPGNNSLRAGSGTFGG